MSSLLGLRVFPGPSWSYSESDFLGTIDKIVDNVAYVKWDNGILNNYRFGLGNKYDLLIYDSSQIGIEHDGLKCKSCNGLITGSKWGCMECDFVSCTQCYMNDSHNINKHSFYRKDSKQEIGSFVGLRNEDNKVSCSGIFKGSFIQFYNDMFGKIRGTVDSFENKNNSYRSIALIKVGSQVRKAKFGYNGDIEIKLDSNATNDQSKLKHLYRNHLRVINLHPIYNYEFMKIFQSCPNVLEPEIEMRTIDKDDNVYVDCFDLLSLQIHQKDYGESNEKVQNLIGKRGVVTDANGYLIRVYFQDLDENINFNSRILFNTINHHMRIVRICEKSKLKEIIDCWKNTSKTEKLKKDWMPDEAIINKIHRKIGVIIIDNLPGGLVGVRFKMVPDFICMLLPRDACKDIDDNFQCDETAAVSIENLYNCSSNEEGIALHRACRSNGVSTVEILLKKNSDLVNFIDKSNGYSALHYAVENNCISIIKLLMEHNCNIYIQDKIDNSTPLHLALKHYYIESFCCILESLKENLSINEVDKNNDNILHLSASYPTKEMLNKWEKIVNDGTVTSILNLFDKFELFKSNSNHFSSLNLRTMPFATLSCLILCKGINDPKAWFISPNSESLTPEQKFDKSIKSCHIDLSVISIRNSFMIFARGLENAFQSDICEFCNWNYASITYKPCGHKIHCVHCALMPYKCAKCDTDIEAKLPSTDNSNSYKNWDDLMKYFDWIKCSLNRGDWYQSTHDKLKQLECDCCRVKIRYFVIRCGHQFCRECFEKCDKKCFDKKCNSPENSIVSRTFE